MISRVKDINFTKFLTRAGKNLGLSDGDSVRILEMLDVYLPNPHYLLQIVSGEYLTPRRLPSGRRTMTHFTECALIHVTPWNEPTALAAGYAFCSERDEFVLARGEKVAIKRLLKLLEPETSDSYKNRCVVWSAYFQARHKRDDELFQSIIQALAQKDREEKQRRRVQEAASERIPVYNIAPLRWYR